MNIVRRFFNNNRKHFEPGGRWAKLGFLFEVFEAIFFMPANITKVKPFVRDFLDVKRYMFLVIIPLLPLYAFGVYNAGLQSHLASGLAVGFWPVFGTGLKLVVPVVLVTYIVGFFWEALFAGVRKIPMNEGLFVTCALFPLILPPTIPLWQAGVGITFGVVIGKEIFGGTGHNFLNPALTGRMFLYFAYPGQSSGDTVWTALSGGATQFVDGFTSATPLEIIKTVATNEETAVPEIVDSISSASEQVEQVVEVVKRSVDSLYDQLAQAGYTLQDLFWGLYPDALGSSCTPLIILGGIFLLLIGISDYRIVVGGFIGTLAAAVALNTIDLTLMLDNPYMALNPAYHFLMGGLLFGLFFMATDPVSAPTLFGARWAYGFLIGALVVIVRVFNPVYPEATALVILFMNCFAPLLDEIALKFRLKRRIPNVG